MRIASALMTPPGSMSASNSDGFALSSVKSTLNLSALSWCLKPCTSPSFGAMSTHFAPAFSSASRGAVISICSKPSVRMIATRFPFKSFMRFSSHRIDVQITGTQLLRHSVQRFLPFQKSMHVRRCNSRHRAARFERRRSDVRRQNNILHRQQPPIHRGLEFVHIECGAAEVAGFESVAEGVLVDDRPASRIDDEYSPFHFRERSSVDHVVCLGCQRRVDGY